MRKSAACSQISYRWMDFASKPDLPSNDDWICFLRGSSKDTAKHYLEAVGEFWEFCCNPGKDIFTGNVVKDYLVFRHKTPRIVKKANRRFGHVKWQTFKQLKVSCIVILVVCLLYVYDKQQDNYVV